MRGWALAEQGQEGEGIAQIQQGIRLDTWRATGTGTTRPQDLAFLAEAYGKVGQAEDGRTLLAEALAQVHKSGECWLEAELYRLKGTLTLQSQTSPGQVSNKSQTSLKQVQDKSQTGQGKSEDANVQILNPNAQSEAEASFLKAIDIAQRQQAKSLELRAVMSLVRLRQQQAAQHEHATRSTQHVSHDTHHEARTRLDEAHTMLSEIYNWFTEGFDTKDLQEAKALLDELAKS